MYPASFAYHAPRSVEEAIALLAEHGDEAKLLAGGHSLLPTMKLRLAQPGHLIDLAGVAGLQGIREEGQRIVIGALTTHDELASSSLIRAKLTALAEAAAVVGDPQVRNRGTLGGSAAHADPNADEPVALVALEAVLVMVGPKGRREVPAVQFFEDIFTTALGADEVLTEIVVPVTSGKLASAYKKLPHPASGFVVVSCAAVLEGDGQRLQAARLGMGGLGGAPVRAAAAEARLAGQAPSEATLAAAAALVSEGTDPADDLYASAAYKRAVAQVYARQALTAAAERLRA
ncbi:MAG TPA: xanthine dehydrogenase family protein subunit M [Chloroflexota bacterium]|nr:xanthine dehydrogenase family protein subunit M [Chloroflexota bacterium]